LKDSERRIVTMKRSLNRKLWSVFLAIALTLSMSTTAFAAWPGFQSGTSSNGIIRAGVPPTSAPAVTTLGLPYGGAEYSGVDAESVVDAANDVAYTLYNGGKAANAWGGARVQATTLSTGSTLWNVQVDSLADDVQQLSTPGLRGSTLYAATTHYNNVLASTDSTGWTGAGVSGAGFSFPAGTTTITYSGAVIPSDYWQPQFATDIDISASGLSGDVTLSQGGSTALDFTSQSYYPGYGRWTLYNNSGAMLDDGTYDVTFTVNNNTGSTVEASSLRLLVSAWSLTALTNLSSSAPTLTTISPPAGCGYGQANTPVGLDPSGVNIYLGIYEGDRSYYLCMESGAMNRFIPDGGDDFYWAGMTFSIAAAASMTPVVMFGGDKGVIYIRDWQNFATQGKTLDIGDIAGVADVGQIRSSVISIVPMYGKLYFTSKGTGNNGYLWCIDSSNFLGDDPTVVYSPIGSALSSVSTPVLSQNDILYVGSNNYNASTFSTVGSVEAFDPADLPSGAIATIYTGDPVQSSPILYSDTDNVEDYIYFTTNSGSGKGYCYYWAPGDATTISQEWFAGGTSGNPYALQGFSFDGGYLVYGDDGNYLYIMH
jgi:hypothetical protein